MIHDANDNAADELTAPSTGKVSPANNSSAMSSTTDPPSQPNGEQQQQPAPVHVTESEGANGVTDKESSNENQALVVAPTEDEPGEENDDEFIRITAAHQMLTEAQTYDEQKNYPAALHLYRICVDLLLEELMFTEGTDQSRVYLREKCTALMDRIDLLKTMLEPIPPPPASSPPPLPVTDASSNPPPSDELSSLHIS